jgi:hypothetical protein
LLPRVAFNGGELSRAEFCRWRCSSVVLRRHRGAGLALEGLRDLERQPMQIQAAAAFGL